MTTGNWPNEAKDTIQNLGLPKEIQICIASFNKFYLNKHSGRTLHWKPSLAFAEIRASIGENFSKYDLYASTFQTCVLMLFNQYSQLSFQQLMDLTKIGEKDLKCNIIPLVGIKLLNKSPNNKDL